jgi:hypothetical protein
MGEFTAKEAKEMDIELGLLNEWAKLLDALWLFALKTRKLKAKQGVNEIIIGNVKLGAYFINGKYLDVYVEKGDQELLKIKHQKIDKTLLIVKAYFK